MYVCMYVCMYVRSLAIVPFDGPYMTSY